MNICKIRVYDKETILSITAQLLDTKEPITYGLPDDVMGGVFVAAYNSDLNAYKIIYNSFTFYVPETICEIVNDQCFICDSCKWNVKRTCNNYDDCANCPMCTVDYKCKCTISYDKYTDTCSSYEEDDRYAN